MSIVWQIIRGLLFASVAVVLVTGQLALLANAYRDSGRMDNVEAALGITDEIPGGLVKPAFELMYEAMRHMHNAELKPLHDALLEADGNHAEEKEPTNENPTKLFKRQKKFKAGLGPA